MIRENVALAFAVPLKGISIYNKQLSIRYVGGDAAIVVSKSGILFGGTTEVPDTGKVNATWVFEKRDGQWLIAAYHNSPLLAPVQDPNGSKEWGEGVTTKLEGFDRLVEPSRTELLAYCYRMLGSAHDAEDLIQDTYLRAWRAQEQYDETRSSLRTWLYRIATNVCLTALEVRGRRPLPSQAVATSDPLGPLIAGENLAWLQPLPDSWLDARSGCSRDRAQQPALGVRRRPAAPVGASAGALILRDVLNFAASEAAEVLGTTVASVNSSLQRARTRMKEVGSGRNISASRPQRQRAWVDRYMKALSRGAVLRPRWAGRVTSGQFCDPRDSCRSELVYGPGGSSEVPSLSIGGMAGLGGELASRTTRTANSTAAPTDVLVDATADAAP